MVLNARFFISVVVSFLFIAISTAALELNLNCDPISVASAGTIACTMELSEEVASVSSFTFTVNPPQGFSLASVTNVPQRFKDTPNGNIHIIDLQDAATTGLQPQVLGTLNLLAGEGKGTGEVTLSSVELLDDDLNSLNPTLNPSAALTNTGSDDEAVCGNSLIEVPETCDDGNAADADGCSAACTIEEGFACEGVPSVCVVSNAFTCTGEDPANAEPCAGDDDGLDANADKTTVAACTDEIRCEYICSDGFLLEDGACVPDAERAAEDGDADGDDGDAGDGDAGGAGDDGGAGDGAADISTYDLTADNCLNSDDVWSAGSLLDAFLTKLRELLAGDDGLKDLNTHLWGMYKAWNTGAGCA